MKNKISILVLTILVFTFSGTTQVVDFQWAKSFGGSSPDFGLSNHVDAHGNVYITGYFNGTVDFDPDTGITNLTSNGTGSVFVQKLDPSGNLLWAIGVGGTGTEIAKSICSDMNGNVYIVGSFTQTADFNPGGGIAYLTSNGNFDVYIVKLDSLGNFVWAKSVGGSGSDNVERLVVGAYGNIYITGSFFGIMDFDPGVGSVNVSSNGNTDIFLLKLDVMGDFIWVRTFGDVFYDYGLGIVLDSFENVYTTGIFRGTVDFDPGAGVTNLTSIAQGDVFIQKLNPSGNLLWVKSVSGSFYDSGGFITIDDFGRIILAGTYSYTVDFDPGVGVTNLTSNGARDIFILKLDSLGGFLWAKGIGGVYDEGFYSLSSDANGNVYATGVFRGTVDFDPGMAVSNITAVGSWDTYVLKLDSIGGFVFGKYFQGVGIPAKTFGRSIYVDQYENIYVTGYFSDSVYFNPNSGVSYLVSAGFSDWFIVKFSQCISNTSVLTETACESYVSPSGQVWSSSGTFTDTLQNIGGCDSVISINLTINSIDSSIVLSGFTLTSSQSGGLYQWYNCDSMSPIVGANSQSFTPQSSGNYMVEVTLGECKDTLECQLVLGVRVEAIDCGCEFYIPNSFTPNGDGLNDYFLPISDCEIHAFYFSIVDRWGIEVFSTENPNYGWDGTFKGQPVSIGVFSYILKYNYYHNGKQTPYETIFGSVTVVK